MARVETTLPWFRAMAAEDRSWITLVAQAGIGSVRRVVPATGVGAHHHR